jgi:hypothetical protein
MADKNYVIEASVDAQKVYYSTKIARDTGGTFGWTVEKDKATPLTKDEAEAFIERNSIYLLMGPVKAVLVNG